jgi:hypothetical protein
MLPAALSTLNDSPMYDGNGIDIERWLSRAGQSATPIVTSSKHFNVVALQNSHVHKFAKALKHGGVLSPKGLVQPLLIQNK